MQKSFAEMNYYEMLDAKPDAAFFEIRNAYKEALQMYQTDSMVSHSIFSEKERSQILSLVEKAYLTLINEKERQIYDNELIAQGVITATKWKVSPKRPLVIFDTKSAPSIKNIVRNNSERRDKIAQDRTIAEIINQNQISGADLQRIRKKLEVTVEDIAEETKISAYYIRNIEGDTISRLPATVFLKGFIKAYLKCLCLEPIDVISNKYMNYLAGFGEE